jgi:hypothetical protein
VEYNRRKQAQRAEKRPSRCFSRESCADLMNYGKALRIARAIAGIEQKQLCVWMC